MLIYQRSIVSVSFDSSVSGYISLLGGDPCLFNVCRYCQTVQFPAPTGTVPVGRGSYRDVRFYMHAKF